MEFLSNTDNIRNICILAHVDHGKTTIADSLIASNGIISLRMSGQMRYMDNRQDEQERGITMKSSSIALKYKNKMSENYLINLVDTPGHVDFCGEVSAAVRLCDGALIVIDVVEGVCPQTKIALEQAWKEGIEPILVLNKIDRMILEQQLDEIAAHLRLNQILEQVNAIVATLLTTEIFENEATASAKIKEESLKIPESNNQPLAGSAHVYDWASTIEDIDDDKYYFMPEKNNVVFSSSIDGWAFTIGAFAEIISSKHKINLNALQKTLWGDFYIDAKQKRIMKNAQAKSKKTLFTSMVLDNIWKIYDTVCVRRDKVRMEKICQALEIELSPRDLNHTDARYQVKLIMSKWLSLADHVLESVTKLVQSPNKLSEKRIERLLSSNLKRFDQLPEETRRLKDSFLKCSSSDDAVKVACISKMIPFDKKNLPENRRRIIRKPRVGPSSEQSNQISVPNHEDIDNFDHDSEETVFIAFARVFSGKINKGDKLYVLGPKHDPSRMQPDAINKIDESKKLDDLSVNEHVTIASVENFYLLMGREIEKLDFALAGNIVGIQGLDQHLIRTATLSNDIFCPPFNDLHLPATPILRVAIEPKNPLEMSTLVNGLKLLNQADPCVEVKLQETGEHVIVATGEVHLEHCIKDLREKYANNIELNVSQPIVPFRETIVLTRKTDMVNEAIDDNNTEMSSNRRQTNKGGIFETYTPNKRCRIKLKASPLPEALCEFLIENGETLKVMSRLLTSRHRSTSRPIDQLSDFNKKKIEELRSKFTKCITECRASQSVWKHLYQDDMVDRIWSFGPKYFGQNILLSDKSVGVQYSQWNRIYDQDKVRADDQDDLHSYIDSFISGFQLATQSGPLCEEPMMGVCFTILEWTHIDSNLACVDNGINKEDSSSDCDRESICSSGTQQQAKDNYGPMSGQIISTVKEACRKAFQLQPQRLMSPMFSCDIQVTTEVLGKMYAVLGRRFGRIVHSDMREGSQTFEIKAFIPVIESLDFVSEIRKQTSGMANPQLIFSHYEIVDVDPYWTPSTEEEYALFGEKADFENQALKYMNMVRRRKGLSVQEKIVEHGEKQRTIKRNK